MFAKGQVVSVFYRAWVEDEEWHAETSVATPSHQGVALPVPLRLSAGWVIATVLHDLRPAEDRIVIRYTSQRWFNLHGEPLDPKEEGSLDSVVHPSLVRNTGSGAVARPKLSLLAVRWGGPPETAVDTSAFNWGPTNSSVSSTYANTLFEVAYDFVGTDLDIRTLFVSSAEELRELSAAAPELTATLTGTSCAALYFLWPATYGEPGSTIDGSLELGGGFVEASALFALMRRMELSGVPSRFPHPAPLYDTLVSKSWQASLCANGTLQIPATTAVPVALVKTSPLYAAQTAVEALNLLEGAAGVTQDRLPQLKLVAGGKWSEVVAAESGAAVKGCSGEVVDAVVVKLGFSWEAADVTKVPLVSSAGNGGATTSAAALECLGAALTAAVDKPGCRNDVVLVQRFVPACCELRLFIVEGSVRGRYFARYENTTDSGKFESWNRLEPAEAVVRWFGGDAAALAAAEADAVALVPKLLATLRGICAEAIAAIRFDFLLEKGARVGEGKAWLLEMTEAGFSMWGWDEGPPQVFGAIVAACLGSRTVNLDASEGKRHKGIAESIHNSDSW